MHVSEAVCLVLAAMFFLAYLQSGLDREATIRCTACGARAGEKHNRDCHYKDRL